MDSDKLQMTFLDYLMSKGLEAKIRLEIDGAVKYYDAKKETFTKFQNATSYCGDEDLSKTTTFYDIAEIQQCISVYLNTEIEIYDPVTGNGVVRTFFPNDLEVDISDFYISKAVEAIEENVFGRTNEVH